jgi:hypothetical protein
MRQKLSDKNTAKTGLSAALICLNIIHAFFLNHTALHPLITGSVHRPFIQQASAKSGGLAAMAASCFPEPVNS